MATIQIPVLFDMSGDTLVFGEEVSGDFISSHLDFLLDMTTEANDISLNAADISSAILIGDSDSTDNIFYSGGSSSNIAVDNLCNRIAKAVTRGKLVHIPKTGNSSNSGIPMGGRLYVVREDGQQEVPPDGQYAVKYLTSIAPIGDEQMLGEAMARVTSVHLMGTPLAASILVNKDSVQTDLETASAQTFNSGNTAFYNALAVQLSKVLGGSKSSAPMNNGTVTIGTSGTNPYDVASSNSTLSGQTYTSSTLSSSTWGPPKAFDTIWSNANAWNSNVSLYSGNNYTGSESTAGYNGEWLQVDIGQSIVLKSYEIFPGKDESYGNPMDMRLFSSTDGTNWTQIQDWTGLTYTNDFKPGGTWSSLGPYTTNTTGRYFRLVVNKVIGNVNYATIGELTLKGMLPSEDATTTFYPLDASGVACPALKSIYEQLMNVSGRSQIMPTRDISGVVDNSNSTLTGGFPFIAGDKLVMYLRPKIVFAAQTQAESNNALYTFNYTGTTVLTAPAYNISDKNGNITGQTYSQSSSQDNTDFIFEHATDGNGAAAAAAQYWITAANTYHNTTGVHSGANALGSTNLVDGANTVAGEYGQVDIGQNTFATELQLTTNGANNDRMATDFKLLGSTNGTNWVTLIDKTGAGPWVDDTPQTFTIASPASYRYYRYIIIKCYNAVTGGNISNRGSLGYFNLRGGKFPSEVIENTNAGLMDNSPLDISGLQTNVVASTASISAAFPGNATSGPEAETSKWGWMGSVNSDSFTLDSTNVTDPRTIDLHIWKITITL